ncbi:MAG TPA: CsbD family protein [Opitutales bacterium]|jgi:uncharacterized protein YjbJ (UPF0337 family)|nr:CsbD family protein [Opitutales bacterium]
MNKLVIKGDWNIVKGKLKEKWSALTDNDLEYVSGQTDVLLGRIQKSTGATLDAIHQAMEDANS